MHTYAQSAHSKDIIYVSLAVGPYALAACGAPREAAPCAKINSGAWDGGAAPRRVRGPTPAGALGAQGRAPTANRYHRINWPKRAEISFGDPEVSRRLLRKSARKIDDELMCVNL